MFSSKVGFPFIAKFATSPTEFRKVLSKYRLMVLAVGAVLLTFTICVGDVFILHVYKKPFHGAAWMIAIFGLGLCHRCSIAPSLRRSCHCKSRTTTHWRICSISLLSFILIATRYSYFGIVGAVAAVAVSDLPMYVVNVYASYQQGLGMLRQDGLMTLVFIGTLAEECAIGMLSDWAFRFQGYRTSDRTAGPQGPERRP